jgi:hypothetical protein
MYAQVLTTKDPGRCARVVQAQSMRSESAEEDGDGKNREARGTRLSSSAGWNAREIVRHVDRDELALAGRVHGAR